MKVQKSGKAFESCPDFEGRAVCVDVTPLEKRETKFGPKEQFKIVFEVDLLKSDGSPYCVWSMWFTPSCHEKASLAKFIKDWFGRALTDKEWESFDTEDLIGRPANVIVVTETEGDEHFANIKLVRPHKTGEPLKPSGKFKRKKDRGESGNTYAKTGGASTQAPTQSTDQPASAAPETPGWLTVKVHVGKNAGHELRELEETAIKAIIDNWVPVALKKEKLTADDKRLIQALEAYSEYKTAEAAKPAAPETDDVPY